MKKFDIIDKVATERNITKKEATEIVDFVIDTMKTGVIEDGVCDIYGFVKIEKVHKDASVARNPKTGEKINVAAKNAPKAKFSKTFKDELN